MPTTGLFSLPVPWQTPAPETSPVEDEIPAAESTKETTQKIKEESAPSEKAEQKDSYEEYKKQGLKLLQGGRYKEALKILNIAKNLHPTLPEIYKLLGETYEQMGDYESAYEYYDTAINLINTKTKSPKKEVGR